MTNNEDSLTKLASLRSGWTRWDSLAVLGSVSAIHDEHVVGWDSDAGELWAFILRDKSVEAIVSMDAPIVFVFETPPRLEQQLKKLERLVSDRVVIVTASDANAAELVASEEIIAAAFPGRPLSPVLSSAGFSALDLTFATS